MPPEPVDIPTPPAPDTRPGNRRTGLDLDLSHLSDAPTWEIRPVVAAPIEIDGVRYHRVATGETGIAIARAYGVSWRSIVASNGLSEPFVLRVGERLVLPSGINRSSGVVPRRRAPLQLNIDDIVTGGEPAVAASSRVSLPLRPSTAPGRFIWPTAGRVTDRFGPAGGGRFNQGIDIATSEGAGVRAAAAGTIAYVGTGVPGYGGLILIRHDGGWISAYGRVASAGVAKGNVVTAGQTIGRASEDPLHFELRRARTPVDPVKYLPPR